MNEKARPLFVINPGSTSIKLACFLGKTCLENEEYPLHARSNREALMQESEKRVRDTINTWGERVGSWHAIVSRGGLVKPMPAGVYQVSEEMCKDLEAERFGSHPSSIGPILAFQLSRELSCPALVVDPPSTDEFSDLARISGTPLIERRSAFHALNQKAAARHVADLLGKPYEDSKFVVAHLGGGITVGAHNYGRVVDATHGLGEGPMTPERAGDLPSLGLVELIFHRLEGLMDGQNVSGPGSGGEKPCLPAHRLGEVKASIISDLVGGGGISAYLGTKDIRLIEKQEREGCAESEKLLEALAYQIAKSVGAMAAVLQEGIDAVVLTGGLTRSETMVQRIKNRVSFLAPVFIAPENEMQALALGALEALAGRQPLLNY